MDSVSDWILFAYNGACMAILGLPLWLLVRGSYQGFVGQKKGWSLLVELIASIAGVALALLIWGHNIRSFLATLASLLS